MNSSDFATTNIQQIANPDMELELLGSLLLKDGLIIPKIAAILKPDDFSTAIHRLIYQTILNLHNRAIVPNVANIYEELQKHRDFNGNESVFLNSVLNIGNAAFTTAYSESHAKTIKDKSVRRQLGYLSKNLQRDIDNPAVDTNKLLADAQSAFRILSNVAEPPKLISPTFYFNHRFTNDVNHNKLYANRNSGFSNIDEYQIFNPGLYVVGATPAAGKTTFCWQLLEQFAKSGETCIFCSYEMSALELFSKTLSRELFLRDDNSTLERDFLLSSSTFTAADIRRGAFNHNLEDLLIELCSDKNLKGVNLFELRDESIDDLLRLLKPFCSDNSKSPIVCLDYLQIVPPANDKQLFNDKAKIDDIVHKLKSFQRETNTTFFVISSFNRGNYSTQVSFESFKDSGNIEYTADVIWALQLYVVNHIKTGVSVSDSRKLFDDAKKARPREIQLKCLKNRHGQNYDCFFNYFSAHDFFQPADDFNANIDNPPAQADYSDNDNAESVEF